MTDMTTFGIGEAARRASVSADLIRYYERVGILPPAPRGANGYRRYSEETLARVVFARNAIRFGFSSKELAGFFKSRAKGQPPCRSVQAAGRRLLGDMDARLAALVEARKELAATLAAWDARLSETPAGQPARLLEMIPELPRRDHF
jgi:DNA-binding transcriptional MerR regulator